MLYRFYKYLYYRIYSWNLRLWGEADVPEYNAMLAIAMLTLINIVTILTVLGASITYNVFDFFNQSKIILLICILCFLMFHYSILFHGGKYKKIIKEFANETEEHRKKGTFWVLCYVVGSVITLFGSWGAIYILRT